MTEGADDHDRRSGYSRRQVLSLTGGAIGLTAGSGALAYERDNSYADADGDGIPDATEESTEFHRFLVETFGASQVEPLEPNRPDLLVDARYIGETTVGKTTKQDLERLFRRNGIYLQWLDYPERYDRDWFEREYGYTVENAIWPVESFYADVVDPALRDVALQLIVIPDTRPHSEENQLESHWSNFHDINDEISGMSMGNRAIVIEQDHAVTELPLILHEIAHLGLCHDDDPANEGVMGPAESVEPDLTDDEWAQFADNLDNIRDSTGFDVVFRRCLWAEFLAELKAEWL